MKTIIFTVINDLTYDQRMQKICSTLAKSGWKVTLVGRKLPTSFTLAECTYSQKRLSCFFHYGKLFYIEYTIRLFFYLLFIKSSVISAVDADTLVPCFLVSKIKSCKLVFDAHEYFSEVPELAERPIAKKVWQWVEQTFIPRVKNKYTVSKSLADEFAKKFNTPFDVVRNVPFKILVEPQISGEKFILYQGALNQGRALEQLILAMHRIPLTLKIAGEGDLSKMLRELVTKEGLLSKVDFLGFVAPEKLRQLTSQAYLGYNLLTNQGLSYYYSLSNKFFDYLQAGIPSMNPNFPEYRKLIEHNKVGVICNSDSDAIAEEVNRLLANEHIYYNLQAECIRMRHNFTWENEAKKIIALYETLR
jgi:glycosyltransferase involved in cell wall biosynthesis